MMTVEMAEADMEGEATGENAFQSSAVVSRSTRENTDEQAIPVNWKVKIFNQEAGRDNSVIFPKQIIKLHLPQ